MIENYPILNQEYFKSSSPAAQVMLDHCYSFAVAQTKQDIKEKCNKWFHENASFVFPEDDDLVENFIDYIFKEKDSE